MERVDFLGIIFVLVGHGGSILYGRRGREHEGHVPPPKRFAVSKEVAFIFRKYPLSLKEKCP